MESSRREQHSGAPSGQKRALLMRLLREQNEGTANGGQGSALLPLIEPDPARRDEPFPLTDIQRAYWIGRSAAYELGDVSIHVYIEVEGEDIDLQRLQEAWRRLVTRHDMLRAVVLPDGRQRILSAVPPYEFQVADLRGQNAEVLTSRLAATRDELSHQVLNAEVWPGFDIRATILDGSRIRLHISIDMLNLDAGSLMILLGEWIGFYQDSAAAHLPPLELSYRDYVLGEIALHESEVYQRSVEYWRDRAGALPPAPPLPADEATDAAARTCFGRRSATLEPGSWQRLRARATQSGVTPSAVLLTAYSEVLASWCRDDAFTMNVTLFNRLPIHPQVNNILGDFTSMLLVEAPNSPESSFAERCMMVQKEMWAGLEHRYVSGIQVLRELARAHRKTSGAIMPVVFTSLLDLPAQDFPSFSSLRALGEVIHVITQTPQVWLDHQVVEDEGALVLTWDAVEGIFAAGLIDDMFDAYCRFLRRLADDEAAWKDYRHTHLPQEQLAQRRDLNATDAPIPEETLLTLFLRQASIRPDDPAIITSDRTLTYAQTLQCANRLGRTLRTLGAQPNTLVAVVMEKGWEQVAATLGIHAAGAAFLPVDPGLPAERRAYLLEHGGVRFAITQPCLDQQLEWPTSVKRLFLDDDARWSDADDAPLTPVQRPEDLSHVIYTSGSTGLPKGVMIEHRNVVNRIVDVNQRLRVGPADKMLALTALHHDLSVYDIFGTLAAGGTLVIPDAARTRDPAHWAELMAREGVTLWNSVPAFLEMLVEYLEQRADHPELLPHSLRCAVLAGDWIPVTLPDRLRALVGEVQLIASGGPTETTIWDIWYPVGKVDPAWQSIPYGKPMRNTHYYVLNRALEPCPDWVPGELCIGGAGLARGYWQDEMQTRQHFITHPHTGERIYRSGDMGRYLPDGNIEFLGRDDFQVKIRGHRIELGEIEAAVRQHPAVSAAAVAAVGAPKGLTHLVAYVVPKKGSAAAAGSAAPDGSQSASPDTSNKPADVKPEQLSGISVLDHVARIDFKLNQWGIRRDTDLQAIPFLRSESDETLHRAYTERSSVREFSPGLLPFAKFGEFLRSLVQIEMDGLPKYRYPSGGGLYPVQTYLYIKPERIESVPGGIYYHDPKAHRLLEMTPGAQLDDSTQAPHNRALFNNAAFVVFLIGQLKAVEPLYGTIARDFCLLEAGYMGQLLMTVAPANEIGVCAIGGMEFEPIRPLFHLDEGHILVHLLVGGGVGGEPNAQGTPASEAAHTLGPASPEGGNLVGDLRAFLKKKLPEQMQPSAYVLLESLPLTSNGKVDRQLLPAPDEASRSAQPPTPPRNDAERILAGIVEEILQIERPSVHENFFDLGGTSVHMVQILNKISEVFEQEIPIRQIFRNPTISSLAASMSGEKGIEHGLAQSDQRADNRRAELAARRARMRGRPGTSSEEGVPEG